MPKTIPKTETIWQQFHTPCGDYIITSDQSRIKYTLWRVDTDGAMKIKSAQSPSRLREFLDPLWEGASGSKKK